MPKIAPTESIHWMPSMIAPFLLPSVVEVRTLLGKRLKMCLQVELKKQTTIYQDVPSWPYEHTEAQKVGFSRGKERIPAEQWESGRKPKRRKNTDGEGTEGMEKNMRKCNILKL